MAVEGRISLSQLSNSLCETKRTPLSLLVDRCISHKNCTADKHKPFSSLELCQSRLENILFTFPLRVTDKQCQKFSRLHCLLEDFPPIFSDWWVPEVLVNTLSGPTCNTVQTDFLWLSMLYFLTTGAEFSFSSKILNKAFAYFKYFPD